MAPPPRPSSPSQLPHNLIQSLKRTQNTLTASKDELGRLDIPKLKDSLVKLRRLLEFAERSKGNEEVIRQLVGHAERLHQTTLAPILEAKRDPSFSISAELTRGLCDLFKELDAALPERSRSSRLSLIFGSVDAGSVILEANPKIESALNTFLNDGNIKRTNGCHLVQVVPSSQPTSPNPRANTRLMSPQRSQEQDDIVETEAGPSSPSQLSELPSQVQRALTKCPRFRILLLGKSGAGKSSLINKVFGVSSAEVAHYQAGRAAIGQEHTSESNPYFVLHDSMGFESGSLEQYAIVENFIQERGRKPELAEKLHAIWLCTSVPVSGGRVFETGDEQIFNLNLGNVPIVVVFTKYDSLVTKAEMEAEDLSDVQVRAKADQQFEGLCAQPLQQICVKNLKRKTPPFRKVSVEDGFEDTLTDLIRLTRSLLPPDAREKVPADMGFNPPRKSRASTSASGGPPEPERDDTTPQDQPISTVGISFAVAQRADPSIKIDAIIAIGRQRYWKGLASSIDFSGKKLERCIAVVHNDIVQVWNFLDPKMCLSSGSFKLMMTKIVEDLFNAGSATSTAKLAASLGGAAGVTGVLAAVAPPSALIVGPLALTAVLAKWVYDVYQQTPGVVRCLMAYIVDLTIVMQRLFWHMQVKGGIYPVPDDLVKLAADEYNGSPEREVIHRTIERFVDSMGIIQKARKDVVVNEVERLIREHRFEPT